MKIYYIILYNDCFTVKVTYGNAVNLYGDHWNIPISFIKK